VQFENYVRFITGTVRNNEGAELLRWCDEKLQDERNGNITQHETVSFSCKNSFMLANARN